MLQPKIETENEHRSSLIPFILVSCTAVSTLSQDLYAPSLAHFPEIFATSASTAQLTMSLNLAAYAIAQLFHGPLSDRYGRKNLLIVALSAFCVVSVLCAAATDIKMLILGRIFQGLLISVPSVVVVLLIRELYAGRDAIRMMGLYGMMVGLAPSVGPLIGGYAFIAFGWKSNFWILSGLGALVALLVWKFVPESRPTTLPQPVKQIFKEYLTLLKHPPFWKYAIPLSCIFGGFFAFVTNGPLLFINDLGIRTEHYGWYFGGLILSYVVGSLVANRLADLVDPELLILAAVVFPGVGLFLLWFCGLTGWWVAGGIVLGMSFHMIGLGLLFAVGPIKLLDVSQVVSAGIASAFLGTCQLGAASLAGIIVGALYSHSAGALILTVSVFTIGSLIGFFSLRNN